MVSVLRMRFHPLIWPVRFDRFARTGPDQLWVTDITEHRTREGKVYCAVVLDVFSRRVVGRSIDSSPTSSLVTSALGMAINNRDPDKTVIHSDHRLKSASTPHGRLPIAPANQGWSRRWVPLVTASTMLLSSHSGRGCRSSYSTDSDGGLGSSSPTPSSTTSRSSTTGKDATRHLRCEPQSNTR